MKSKLSGGPPGTNVSTPTTSNDMCIPHCSTRPMSSIIRTFDLDTVAQSLEETKMRSNNRGKMRSFCTQGLLSYALYWTLLLRPAELITACTLPSSNGIDPTQHRSASHDCAAEIPSHLLTTRLGKQSQNEAGKGETGGQLHGVRSRGLSRSSARRGCTTGGSTGC